MGTLLIRAMKGTSQGKYDIYDSDGSQVWSEKRLASLFHIIINVYDIPVKIRTQIEWDH